MDGRNMQHDYYVGFQEAIILSSRGQQASAVEILKRADLEIAFGFEKLLNLEMLAMEIARRAADIEPLMREPHSLSAESVGMAFEFHVLYGIVESEVNELEKLVGSVQMDIRTLSEEEQGPSVRDKLLAAAESLKQMQELISVIRRESASIVKVIQPSNYEAGTSETPRHDENGHMSPLSTMQTEDPRNVLQMLDQSIASELDLQKELSDSRYVVEELQMKLRLAEQESYFLEDSIDAIHERMFAAENASQLFLGISKELIGKINTTQLYFSASVCREGDLKSKLEESLMKLTANKSTQEAKIGDSDNNTSQEVVKIQTPSPPEFLTLQEKIQQLEEWLRDYGAQPQWSSLSRGANEEKQNMTQSEINTFWNIINDLKVATSNAESRTQSAEARCKQLTQTNVQLNGQLNSLKTQGSDRAGLLEKRLEESDNQLEHAKASVDAIVEQQSMLKSSMSDMEQTIEDLKEKFLKAETRAENAESKCTLLTDTNIELSEELSFLRGRVESLENSLHQAKQLKMSTAKDIGIRTKTITDLVAKLALERESLHQQAIFEVLDDCPIQIVTLTKRNKMLAQKCKENGNEATLLSKKVTAKEGELGPVQVMEEAVVDLPSTQTKAMAAKALQEKEAEVSEDESGAESTLETVRSIDPTLLNWKYICSALLVLLAAVLVYLLYKEDDRV
ncbi:hypothetical protein ACP70R_030837 [Stipagrostis hirtigluma subsp. patula]